MVGKTAARGLDRLHRVGNFGVAAVADAHVRAIPRRAGFSRKIISRPGTAGAPVNHAPTTLRWSFSTSAANACSSSAVRPLTTILDLGHRSRWPRPTVAYRGLQAMLDRNGGQSSGMIHGLAYTLLILAKHWARLPDADLQKLRTACRRLRHERQGMTEKGSGPGSASSTVHRNLNNLLLLPEKLLHQARTKRMLLERAAGLVEVALAIELLTMTALRVKNLARLNLDENVHWTQCRSALYAALSTGVTSKTGSTATSNSRGRRPSFEAFP